jgi:hypothetical protein
MGFGDFPVVNRYFHRFSFFKHKYKIYVTIFFSIFIFLKILKNFFKKIGWETVFGRHRFSENQVINCGKPPVFPTLV